MRNAIQLQHDLEMYFIKPFLMEILNKYKEVQFFNSRPNINKYI